MDSDIALQINTPSEQPDARDKQRMLRKSKSVVSISHLKFIPPHSLHDPDSTNSIETIDAATINTPDSFDTKEGPRIFSTSHIGGVCNILISFETDH